MIKQLIRPRVLRALSSYPMNHWLDCEYFSIIKANDFVVVLFGPYIIEHDCREVCIVLAQGLVGMISCLPTVNMFLPETTCDG